MGDISDLMLDGTLCECCGVYMGDGGIDTPRRCRGCLPSRDERKAANIARHEAEQARQRKAKCTVCGRRVRLVGMADHMRDAHGERPGTLSQ